MILKIPDGFSYSVLIRNMFPCDKHDEGKTYHFVFLDCWVTFDISIWFNFINPTWSRIGVLGLKTIKITCIEGIRCFLVDYNTATGDFYQGHSWSLSVKEIWPQVARTFKIDNGHHDSKFIIYILITFYFRCQTRRSTTSSSKRPHSAPCKARSQPYCWHQSEVKYL